MEVKDWLGHNNEIGIDIWNKKYRYNNENFDDWLYRVSGGDSDVANLILDKKFLFGGRILSNRGLEKDGKKISLSNCYVLSPPEDNIESIFNTASEMARTFSYGGGVGIDISQLSPKGAKINNAAETTTGSTSFMKLYSLVSELIGSSGRRGALMLSIACDHPDLEDFIDIKNTQGEITGANISIRMTREFLEAAKKNEIYRLEYYRNETDEYIYKDVNARDIMMKIAENNWRQGEPGIIYWDNIESYNLLNEFDNFEYASLNPCALVVIGRK